MIAEALAAAAVDRASLARLAGPLGDAARAAFDRLATISAPERRARRAAWAAAARAPVPAGIRGVHPTWIEAALAELPARARADLARAGSGAHIGAPDPVAVWLVRRACAGLPLLPVADLAAPPRNADEAGRLRGDAIAPWLAEIGADQLALALGAAGGTAIASAARALGEQDGARLLRAAARITRPPRAGALGPVRAAVARCRIALDDRALVEIGARAAAPHLDPLAQRRLAVRLPRPLGLGLAATLAAHSAAPVDQAPTWAALAAP